MDKEIKGRLPPFTEALINHTKEKQFPFDTPGHHSGDFYNLTEEGKAFTRFYGNAMFAADMSDSGNDPGAPSSPPRSNTVWVCTGIPESTQRSKAFRCAVPSSAG